MIEASAQLQVIHDRRGLLTQIGEGKADGTVFAVTSGQVARADRQRNGRRVGGWQVGCLTLRRCAGPDVLTLGKQLMRVSSGLAAVVVWPADLHHLHARVDQVDHRFEARVVQRIGQQTLRRVIGGDQQQNASTEQRFEQTLDQHRVADVMDMEFVETQHSAIAQQIIQGGRQRVRLIAMAEHPLMQPGKKLVEVQALFLFQGNSLEEAVEQPTLAATHGTVQIEAGQGGRCAAQQCCGVLRHAVDHALLTVTEGVALRMSLAVKVIVDDPACCGSMGVRSRGLAEQAAQRWPARCETQTVGRSNGHCDVTP